MQYGLRIKSDEFHTMTWDEFSDLLSGLNEDTPLVRVAMIRTESDPERIKAMTPEQRAMRAEWRRRRAYKRPESETKAFLDSIQKAFAASFGEG